MTNVNLGPEPIQTVRVWTAVNINPSYIIENIICSEIMPPCHFWHILSASTLPACVTYDIFQNIPLIYVAPILVLVNDPRWQHLIFYCTRLTRLKKYKLKKKWKLDEKWIELRNFSTFSQQERIGLQSSRTWCFMICWMVANISEKPAAFTLKVPRNTVMTYPTTWHQTSQYHNKGLL